MVYGAYIYALNCRIYGRLSTSSAVEFMVDKLDVGVEIYFEKLIPICSMYGIFTYIWVIFSANVGKYSIHGAYGIYNTCFLYVAS